MPESEKKVCYCCGKGRFRIIPDRAGYYCDHCFAIFSSMEMMLYEDPSADYDVPPRTWARGHGGDGGEGLAKMTGWEIIDVRGKPVTGKDLHESLKRFVDASGNYGLGDRPENFRQVGGGKP